MPYFDARELPNPSSEYVSWVDVMGIQSSMKRSINTTANFVYKLHIAALEAPSTEETRLYPVMDGLYVSSPSRESMVGFLGHVFREIAMILIAESKPLFRFVIRGGISHGEVFRLYVKKCG